jgi:hypothetical protein
MTRITTLIPAYKPDYLGEMFLGLRRQSFRDFRIILSDDSPGGVITDMLRDGRFGPLATELNMVVVRGPGNARRNHQHLLDQWAAGCPAANSLVHFMLDDDVVFPEFYKSHVEAHATGKFALSVSPRWLSQGDSRPAWTLPLPAFVTQSPLRAVPVNAKQLFTSVVPSCENWLGELSNMVWSAAGVKHYPTPPSKGLSYYGLLDISAVLEAGRTMPLVFLRDHLSVFRQHAEQTTRGVNSHGHRVTMLVWAACALHAWKEKRITDADAAKAITITVQRCLKLYGENDAVMNGFYELVQHQGTSLANLHTAFTAYWLALLASHPSTAAQTYAKAADSAADAAQSVAA